MGDHSRKRTPSAEELARQQDQELEQSWANAWNYLDPERLLSLPENAENLLRRYNLRPSRGLGQNFLIDNAILTRIVHAAALEPSDEVLEVGPGLGILTRELLARAKRVVAIELDRQLINVLPRILGEPQKLELVQADVLKFNPADYFADRQYKVVANLPYYITSPTLRHFLEAPARPKIMVIMVQKEVGERIVAQPGDMSLLAVSVQYYGEPRLVGYVPAEAFYPAPKVDSAIVSIEVFEHPRFEVNTEKFFKLVTAGFAQPRKQLHNVLQQNLWMPPGSATELLREADIEPSQRAQTLSMQDWERLYHIFVAHGILK